MEGVPRGDHGGRGAGAGELCAAAGDAARKRNGGAGGFHHTDCRNFPGKGDRRGAADFGEVLPDGPGPDGGAADHDNC